MPLFDPPNVEKLKEKGDVKGLIKALGYRHGSIKPEHTKVRKAAVEALSELGNPQAVVPLIQAFEDKDVDVRNAVVAALAGLGDPQAIPLLIQALEDRNDYVRNAAISVLGKLGTSQAVYPLIFILQHDQPSLRCSAAWALGCSGDPEAVKPLKAALNDDDLNVREEASTALNNLVEPLITLLQEECSFSVPKALGEIGDSRAVEPLIAALKNWKIQKYAAEALGKLDDGQAVNPLINAVQNWLDEDRIYAVRALGQLRDERAITILTLAARSKSLEVSTAATQALNQIKSNPRQDVMNDPQYWIDLEKWDECIAFGAIAADPLISALSNTKHTTREGAADALGKLGDTRAIEPLKQKLRENDFGSVRVAAAKALIQLGWEPGKDADGAAYWIALKEWDECVALGEIAIQPLLVILPGQERAAMYGQHLDTADIIRSLRQLGEPAMKHLLDMLGDDDNKAKRAASEALSQMGSFVVEPLIQKLKTNEVTNAYYWIIKALGAKRDKRALEPLIEMLDFWRADVRKAAVEALSSIKKEQIVEPFIQRLGDSDKEIRKTAASTLVRLHRSARISEETKKSILAQRETIVSHSDWSHECSGKHTDEGIGVDFPL